MEHSSWNSLSIWERRVVWVNDLIARYGVQIQEVNAPPAVKLEAAKAVLYLYDIGVQVDPRYLKMADAMNMYVFGEEGCTCFIANMFMWAKEARANGRYMSGAERFPDLEGGD